MKEIKYVNLSSQWIKERKDILKIIDQVSANGQFVGGDEITKFEKKISYFCKTKYCVSLNSGTDALVCGLIALGIKRGDEVITPPNSFIASTASIVHIGAKPVFVDVLTDQNIDPEKIERSITRKTKAIMPVHLTGRMAKMDIIKKIARKNKLKVIEDAAQSIGSRNNGHLSGSVGDIGCFSTHPLKNLNAMGDGGFVTTNNKSIYNKIIKMRNHGIENRNKVNSFGYVSRLDTIQAAILNYRMKNFQKNIKIRRYNANLYFKNLDTKNLLLPYENKGEYNTYHTFVIMTKFRDQLKKYLLQKNIETAIHYPIPIHLQPAARKFNYRKGNFPISEKQAKSILTLPINQYLTKKQILYVCTNINNFFKKYG